MIFMRTSDAVPFPRSGLVSLFVFLVNSFLFVNVLLRLDKRLVQEACCVICHFVTLSTKFQATVHMVGMHCWRASFGLEQRTHPFIILPFLFHL